MRRVRGVVFDLGETLVDETRLWESWADRLGVPRLTFLGVLGGCIARGEPHTAVFGHLGVDPAGTREPVFGPEDLYPDALPCLAALRAAGLRLAVAGNQPAAVEGFARAHLPVDLVTSSGSLGVAKPDPAFFARLAGRLKLDPGEVAYVGDRVDTDVGPAVAAGLLAVHLRRGPWGFLHRRLPAATAAHVRLDDLAGLPAALMGRVERRVAGVVLVDAAGRLLLQHRDAAAPVAPLQWTMPGGGIEAGEDPAAAARRELREETGLDPDGPLEPVWTGLRQSGVDPAAVVEWHLFTARTGAAQDDVVCGEGQAMVFLPPAEVLTRDLAAAAADLLPGFLASAQYQRLSTGSAQPAP